LAGVYWRGFCWDRRRRVLLQQRRVVQLNHLEAPALRTARTVSGPTSFRSRR
jgi:hypothetical protein